MKISRHWLGALAALSALPAAAKVDDPIDLIQGRWYAAEVIIFERADADEPGPEQLMQEGGRAWPDDLRIIAEPQPWRPASLDPLTRACLEFPRLEVRASTQGAEAEPTGDLALGPWPNPEAGADATPRNVLDMPEPIVAEFIPAQPRPDAMPPDGLTPPEPVALVPPPPIEPRLSPHPLLHLLNTAARQQRALRRDSYRWLPAQTHALNIEARRLRSSPGLDIIWHGRWMQPVPDRSAGQPLMLAAQSASSGGQLSGTLQVTLGRYLHFQATLWLGPHTNEPADAGPYMQLKQARTLRSGELHYLDHPRMGVLVRIDPLPPAPALVEALQAWRQSMLVEAG